MRTRRLLESICEETGSRRRRRHRHRESANKQISVHARAQPDKTAPSLYSPRDMPGVCSPPPLPSIATTLRRRHPPPQITAGLKGPGREKEKRGETENGKRGKDISGGLSFFAATKEQWASISGPYLLTQGCGGRGASGQLAGSTRMKSGKKKKKRKKGTTIAAALTTVTTVAPAENKKYK